MHERHGTPISRRRILRCATGAAVGWSLFGGVAFAKGRRSADPEFIFVVLRLDGGCDGLSVVVPHGDDAYQRARPTLRMARREVLPLDEDRGFHPRLRHLHARFHAGRLALIEGVGVPGSSRTHFASRLAWHTGGLGSPGAADEGWAHRLDCSAGSSAGVPAGGERARADLDWTLRHAASLLRAGRAPRVLHLAWSGFDTHSDQRHRLDGLFDRLDGALESFLGELADHPRGRRTTVLVHSEFGRAVPENSARGTDHGTAGLAFVAGFRVRGGWYGRPPSLTDLERGAPTPTTDFRSVLGALLEGLFGVAQPGVLDGRFPRLPFLTDDERRWLRPRAASCADA